MHPKPKVSKSALISASPRQNDIRRMRFPGLRQNLPMSASAERDPGPLQRGPRARPARTPHLGTLQLRLALGRDERLHPHLHAGVRPDRRRHELVAGRRHHPAGQPDRARSRCCSTRTPAPSTAFPFPVFVRASFGVRGANIPAVLRALVACGWFGIQTWIGGQAIHSMLQILWPAASDTRRSSGSASSPSGC